MTDTDPVWPERLARAQRLVEATGAAPPPYPAREAVDPLDALWLAVYENLTDPAWIARRWLPPDQPEDTCDDR